MTDDEKVVHVFTQDEVAEMLARQISKYTGEFIVEPHIEIGGHDIVLIAKEAE